MLGWLIDLSAVHFFVEEFERQGIGELVEGLDRHFAVHRGGIVGAEHHAHPTLAEF